MNRRTVLKRVGAATAGTIALTGNVAASRASARGVVGDLDVTVDVSDVAGEVVLADVLTDEQLATVDVDPTGVRLLVDPGLDEISTQDHCCLNGCCEEDWHCLEECPCCECDNCEPK